jgi:hypothetical protein
MSLSKQFKTDRSAETDGVVLDYGDGVWIRIARAGGANKKYLRALERLGRKYRRQIQLETLPEEVARKLFRETYAETVVLGWGGITQEDIGSEGDEPVEFTKANCVALFENLPDLFLDVQSQAQNMALFRAELDEDDAKN